MCNIKKIFAPMPQEAVAVLQFWLIDTSPEKHFQKDPAFDQYIHAQFATSWKLAQKGKLVHWLDTAGGRLSFVVLIDQFSRNMFRDTPEAFLLDKHALAVAKDLIARQDYALFPNSWRSFCFLPLMHSENIEDQQQCVQASKEIIRNDNFTYYALQHQQIIARFGRFPHRNTILGRISSPEEKAFLLQPNSSF